MEARRRLGRCVGERSQPMTQRSARQYVYLSIAAALLTMGVKFIGYLLTGSVGLFSDAAESIVNLVAALVALWALTLAARPPDNDHHYGHSKAEYFSTGVEGALILVAAAWIAWEAVLRLFAPRPIDQVGWGLLFAALGAAINGAAAAILWRAGRRLRSVTLEADARHLLTDVWTTGGVIVGVALVAGTGWLALDPLIALAVAANIVWTGGRLLYETGQGFLDIALPAEDQEKIEEALAPYRLQGFAFHAVRTRRAGARRFVTLHVLVPGAWTVQQGHDLSESIEGAIRRELPHSTVETHLEPIEDPVSFADQELDREPDHASTPEAR